MEVLSGTQVILLCKAERGCQSLNEVVRALCDPVPLPLLSTFDSLGTDLLHFVKYMSHRGVGAIFQNKRHVTFGVFCISFSILPSCLIVWLM